MKSLKNLKNLRSLKSLKNLKTLSHWLAKNQRQRLLTVRRNLQSAKSLKRLKNLKKRQKAKTNLQFAEGQPQRLL